jgi:hypothetical protein
MPTAAKRPCPRPGCPELIPREQKYCPKHSAAYEEERRAQRREIDQRRPSARARGYTRDWEKYRRVFLSLYLLLRCTSAQHIQRSAKGRFLSRPYHLCFSKDLR